MRLGLLTTTLALALAAFTGCGGDEDDGAGSKPSPAELADGSACMDEGAAGPEASDCDMTEYSECIQETCSAEYEACLGAGYASGNLSGGRCEEFIQCSMDSADPCNPTGCTPSDDCTACFVEIANCGISAACELPECAGGGGPSPSGSVNLEGGCTELEACCASLSGDMATQCEDSVTQLMGIDLACASALSIYQASGSCN